MELPERIEALRGLPPDKVAKLIRDVLNGTPGANPGKGQPSAAGGGSDRDSDDLTEPANDPG